MWWSDSFVLESGQLIWAPGADPEGEPMFEMQTGVPETRYLKGLFWLTGIAAAAWLLAGWVVGGESTKLALAGLVLIGGVVAATILNNWRSGIYLFLVWLLFEDLARKYLGNNMIVYFGKDFLVGIVYISFIVSLGRREVRTFRPPFLLPLSLFIWLGILQIFNSNSPSFWYGLLGLKLYFYYVPLVFLGYALLRSEMDLHRLLVLNVALAGIVALGGVMQAIIGPDFLNPEVLAPELAALGRAYRSAPISGTAFLRPNSVFVSEGRFSSFLLLMWLLGLGAAGYLLPRTRGGRKLVFAGIALVAAAIVLSGSRGALVYSVSSALVLVAAFLWGGPGRGLESGRGSIRAVRAVLLLVGVSLLCIVFIFPAAVGARWAFYSETLAPDSPAFQVVARAWDYPVSEFLKAYSSPEWLIGNGIGTASLGVGYVSGLLGQPASRLGVESGFGTLILELGILGPLLWLAWSVALLVSSWKVVRRLRGTRLFPIGFAIFWFALLILLPFTYGGLQAYQNYILNAFLWLLVGILFRLPELLIRDRKFDQVRGAPSAHAG
jgi:hypothetical protein